MLFDSGSIISFAEWSGSAPDFEKGDFSELDIEVSGGDLLCELSVWRDEKSPTGYTKQAGWNVFISAPVVYNVTLGDVMSQSIVNQIISSGVAPSIIYEVLESSYINSLLIAEPGVESLVFGRLRHFIIPANNHWLHVLQDGEPDINSDLSDTFGVTESVQ